MGPVLPQVSQSGQAVGQHWSSYLHAEPSHSTLEAEDSWTEQPFLFLGIQTAHWKGPVVPAALYQLWFFAPEWEIAACRCFCYTNHCKRLSGTQPLLPFTPFSI